MPKMKPKRTSPDTLRTKLGRLTRELRISRNMTQEEVGKSAGLTIGHVSLIENGKSNFTLDTLEGIAKAFNLTPVEFLDGAFRNGERSQVDEITGLLPLLQAEKLDLVHSLVKHLVAPN